MGEFVGYSFSSKSVMDCDSFYIHTDNHFNFSLEINILQLIHRHFPWELILQ